LITAVPEYFSYKKAKAIQGTGSFLNSASYWYCLITICRYKSSALQQLFSSQMVFLLLILPNQTINGRLEWILTGLPCSAGCYFRPIKYLYRVLLNNEISV